MPVTLSVWGNAPYVSIRGDLPDHVFDQLDDQLSYDVPDAEYTDAWQNDEWDGVHRLLRKSDRGEWYFPLGLLARTQQILAANGVGYDTEGLTRPGAGTVEYGWHSDIELREYQREAVSDALSHGSGMIVMPTGTGKTVVGLKLIQRLSHPVMVIVHRQEIARQWVERIRDTLGVEPCRYYGGDRENGDVMVALYQSILDGRDVRSDVRLNHQVALFDEAHRVGADSFSRVALSMNAMYRFGFTATPEREDNATLRVVGGTGPVIGDFSVERMIRDGYLAKPEWRLIDAPHSGTRYRNWQQEYKEEIVQNERRNELLAGEIADLEPPTLVTVERVNHGERLASRTGAAFVHGNSDDRDETIQSFRDGDTDTLIATRGIVGEGFDVPEIASFVVGGGLKSSTSLIQQVGRALRPDTDTATVVDCMDRGQWTSKHSEERLRTYREYYGEYGP